MLRVFLVFSHGLELILMPRVTALSVLEVHEITHMRLLTNDN